MGRKLSTPDYYIGMRILTDKYGISDSHAGCYLCQYMTEFTCNRCEHRKVCDMIHEKEKEE